MIVTGDEEKNYYIQFAASAGDPLMMVEVVNNTYLDKQYMLSGTQVDWLLSIGFAQDEEDPEMNLQMFVHIDDEEARDELGELAVEVLTDIYGVAPDVVFDIEVNLG